MLLIRGGTLVDRSGERAGDVLIDGEAIAAVGQGIEAPEADVIDASGALVIPGGIDVHTHFDLPVGRVRSADDFETGTIAAACGGTTCIIDFAGSGRERPDEALRSWHAKADGRAVVDFGFHATLTAVPEDQAEARELFAWLLGQGVASVKLYMAYPDRLMVDDATLGRALRASKETGVLVCVHAEDGTTVERLVAEALAAGRRHPGWIPQTRPPEVEAEAVRRAAALASEAGAPLYVVHLSSAAGLRAVEKARADGRPHVFAETCPQYLFLTSELLTSQGDDALDYVCVPPLRSDDDRKALWEGLSNGSVQVVATDHCPFTKRARRRGVGGRPEGPRDFTEIPGGLPGVETRLSLGFQGVRQGWFTPESWVEAVSGAPARLFGLGHCKGGLEPGLDADVVVFDPSAHKRLDAASLHMATDHSPYQDIEVIGWPAVTMARGRIVARNGEPADVEPGWGRFVHRRPLRVDAR
ncbi:MAG TPA: dihydropyrimidinase [Acidimicrobiia bacterium]|nr:dihydropyrimidinase [Acidimicrobiia bacterium]